MIIKKYVTDTMNEALNLIRLELGSEAVIVSKRTIKQTGLKGMFLPKKLEVTAAVDEEIRNKAEKVEQVSKIKESGEKAEIEQELNEVKEMLQKLVGDKKVKRDKRSGIKKMLLERDVSEEVVDSIVAGLKEKDRYKNMSRLPDSALADEIEELIKAGASMEGKVHAFIGPTGVGKTTTIAKLAAIKSLKANKKVGVITIDTYRIGAVEQLKIYADILGLPFEVINRVNDISKSIERLKDCDYIFVDTTGRSLKNIMQISELKLYLDRIKPDMVHLVISMTTKYNDMVQILNGFRPLGYDSVILTKFDETTTYGSIINLAYNSKVPISYITVGQNVPDDIEEATKEKLIDLVIGEGSM